MIFAGNKLLRSLRRFVEIETIAAGFAHADITPPLGTKKIGWLKEIVPTRVTDPLYARVVVFETPLSSV